MDLTGVSFDIADVLATGSLVLAAVALIWGAKKALNWAIGL